MLGQMWLFPPPCLRSYVASQSLKERYRKKKKLRKKSSFFYPPLTKMPK